MSSRSLVANIILSLTQKMAQSTALVEMTKDRSAKVINWLNTKEKWRKKRKPKNNKKPNPNLRRRKRVNQSKLIKNNF